VQLGRLLQLIGRWLGASLGEVALRQWSMLWVECIWRPLLLLCLESRGEDLLVCLSEAVLATLPPLHTVPLDCEHLCSEMAGGLALVVRRWSGEKVGRFRSLTLSEPAQRRLVPPLQKLLTRLNVFNASCASVAAASAAGSAAATPGSPAASGEEGEAEESGAGGASKGSGPGGSSGSAASLLEQFEAADRRRDGVRSSLTALGVDIQAIASVAADAVRLRPSHAFLANRDFVQRRSSDAFASGAAPCGQGADDAAAAEPSQRGGAKRKQLKRLPAKGLSDDDSDAPPSQQPRLAGSWAGGVGIERHGAVATASRCRNGAVRIPI